MQEYENICISNGIVPPSTKENVDDQEMLLTQITIIDNNNRKESRPLIQCLTPVQAGLRIFKMTSGRTGSKVRFNDVAKSLAAKLGTAFLKPTLKYSAQKTTEERKKAQDSVPLNHTIYAKNEILIPKGKKISQEDLNKLEEHRKAVLAARSSQDFRNQVFHKAGLSFLIILAADRDLKLIEYCFDLGHQSTLSEFRQSAAALPLRSHPLHIRHNPYQHTADPGHRHGNRHLSDAACLPAAA